MLSGLTGRLSVCNAHQDGPPIRISPKHPASTEDHLNWLLALALLLEEVEIYGQGKALHLTIFISLPVRTLKVLRKILKLYHTSNKLALYTSLVHPIPDFWDIPANHVTITQ